MNRFKDKTIADFTQEEREQMSVEERKALRLATTETLKARGYYDNVRIMSKDNPLNPDDEKDFILGKGIGVF